MKVGYLLIIITSILGISCLSKDNSKLQESDDIIKSIGMSYGFDNNEVIKVDSVVLVTFDSYLFDPHYQEVIKKRFTKEDTVYVSLLKKKAFYYRGNKMFSNDLIKYNNRILAFSPIQMDDKKCHALVIVRYFCGKNCSEESIFFMKKHNKKWNVLYKNRFAVE